MWRNVYFKCVFIWHLCFFFISRNASTFVCFHLNVFLHRSCDVKEKTSRRRRERTSLTLQQRKDSSSWTKKSKSKRFWSKVTNRYNLFDLQCLELTVPTVLLLFTTYWVEPCMISSLFFHRNMRCYLVFSCVVLSAVSCVLQENEKLYMQLKAQKSTSQANEGAMFSENQRLLSELALTKWVLNFWHQTHTYPSCLAVCHEQAATLFTTYSLNENFERIPVQKWNAWSGTTLSGKRRGRLESFLLFKCLIRSLLGKSGSEWFFFPFFSWLQRERKQSSKHYNFFSLCVWTI